MKKVLSRIALVLAILAIALGVSMMMPDRPSAIIAGLGTVAVLGMIQDAQCRLSDAQAFAAAGVSTNAYDLGAAGRNPGAGVAMGILISIDVAADKVTGDEAYEFQVVQATANDLTTGQVILNRIAFTAAQVTANALAAGNRIVLHVPMNLVTLRFLGLRVVPTGTTPTVTITADIMPLFMIQNEGVYADAISIL